MLDPETTATIDRLLYDVEELEERLSGVAALHSAEALQRLAYKYNWDDGFEVQRPLSTTKNVIWGRH